VKIKTQARENQLEEAPEKLCLHHGEIREEDVKLSGKGIYSRKKQYRNQRNNNTRNR
jgi:hypothetical protein